MPVAREEWISDPLGVVSRLFGQRASDDGSWGITEFFAEKLNSEQELAKIPSLNDISLDHLTTGSLVRYRCMVQDQFDPELYLKIYHCSSSSHLQRGSVAKVAGCGMYKDIITALPDTEIDFDHVANVHGDRLTLYCVPIPAETQWTKAMKGTLSTSVDVPEALCSQEDHTSGKLKRRLSEGGEGGEGMEVGGCEAAEVEGLATKRLRNTEPSSSSSLEENDPLNTQLAARLNFPLANEQGPPCLVKVYDSAERYKVTTIVEFIGVLSVSPELGHTAIPPASAGEGLGTSEESLVPFAAEAVEERRTHAPPPSLIPRLHSLVARILPHSSPTLPPSLSTITTLTPSQVEEIKASRRVLLDVLTLVYLGDALAAEYTLLHLLSRVYGRTEVLALGKFSLNVTGCPAPLPHTLHATLEHLLNKCHLLPMTLENMNTLRFSPKKDYSANRLLAGSLQLSSGTNLVLDETAMVPGRLDEAGLRNLEALGCLVQWQKVRYDFHFHTADFDCDIPVLVLSEGKSIINSCANVDCSLSLRPAYACTELYHDSVMRFIAGLSPGQVDHMRRYLALLRMAENSINSAVQKQLEDGFVAVRRHGNSEMTGEQFQYLLGVARLVSISLGSHDLRMEHWERARELEQQRRERS